MPSSKGSLSYRESHRGEKKAASYDVGFFEEGTTKHLLWQLEQRALGRILDACTPPPRSALDFACGTGRVLSFLESRVESTTGIDISPEMLGVARERCPRSRIVQGDLTRDEGLLDGSFDLVTAFRFFLNAEEGLRQEALRTIGRVLEPEGRLVANFHLNPNSITGAYLRLRSVLTKEPPNMLAVDQAFDMLRAGGLEPVALEGYGFLLYSRNRPAFARWRLMVESQLVRIPALARLGGCFMIVAKPKRRHA